MRQLKTNKGQSMNEMNWDLDVPVEPTMTAVEVVALPPLTEHQLEKADNIIQWLLTKGVASLSGKAGVGKTFTTRYVIEQLEAEGYYADILATTNKAASILEGEINKSVSTAHSFLKFREKEGEFQPTEETYQIKSKLIILDELSLLDEHILKILYKLFREDGTKLLFVGDKTQLIFSKEVNDKLAKMPTEYLMIPMRAADGSGIARYCSDQSDAIRDGKGRINLYDYQADDLIIYNDKHSFYTAFDALPEHHDKVVISYRNKTVFRHDEILQGRPKGALFQEGDSVRSRDTMKLSPYAAEALGRNEGEIIIRTAEIFKLGHVDYDAENRLYRCTHATKGYIFFVPEFPSEYDRDLNNTLRLCKAGERSWADYYSMKETFCRIYHAQFISCHSAQGSSFDTVFVDARDMDAARDEDTRARLVYTAVGRASKMVHVLV